MIQPADLMFKHILWTPTYVNPPIEYELTTVTYGLKTSPFMAQRVLLQQAEDENSRYPMAAAILESCVYVDDFITRTDTIDEVCILQQELIQLLHAGGFELKKWISSHTEVLSVISYDHQESPLVFDNDDSYLKILGVMWNPLIDSFKFHIFEFNGPITKRSILSYTAKIYDPLRILSPVTFYMK